MTHTYYIIIRVTLILSNIQQYNYVSIKHKLYYAEPVAEEIIDTFLGKFKFLEIDYTCQLEQFLDKVALGDQSYALMVVRRL